MSGWIDFLAWAKIVESAEKLKLNTLLLSCSGCYSPLAQAARGRLQVLSLTELLVQCLEGDDIL